MTGERTLEAPEHAKDADRGSREDLPLWLAAILHLLPGALLMGGVLVLAPPLIERGVPYEIVHIASALLTMVPFMFGAMLLYSRLRHGRFMLTRGGALPQANAALAVRGALRADARRGLRDPLRHDAPE